MIPRALLLCFLLPATAVAAEDAGPPPAPPSEPATEAAPESESGSESGSESDSESESESEAQLEPAQETPPADREAAEQLLDPAPLAVSADDRGEAEALLDDELVEAEPATQPASQPAPAEEASDADNKPPPEEKPEEKPEAKAKPARPPPVQWSDADERIPRLARGSLDACEALVLPVTWLPVVGETVSAVTEWFCLAPATLVVDYLGTFHGGRGTDVWEPFFALLAAKLFRDMVAIVGITVGVAAIVGFSAIFGVVSATILLTPAEIAGNTAAYLPTVGLAGLLTVVGASVVLTRWAQDAGGDLVFTWAYDELTRDLKTDEEVQSAQERSLMQPPLDPFSRAYALLVATLAADPPGGWVGGLPVAGPLLAAETRARGVEQEVRSFGRDVLNEDPQHEEALEVTTSVTTYMEAGLSSAAHALLIVGGVSFVAGLLAAPIVFDQSGDLTQYVIIAATLGSASVVIAGLGVLALLAAEIPRIARAVAVPFAFGVLPPSRDVE